MTSEEYGKAIEEEDARMRALYAQVNEDDLTESSIPLHEIKTMMNNLHKDWDLLEPLTQKQFIQSIFKKIVIHKEKDDWEIVDFLTV